MVGLLLIAVSLASVKLHGSEASRGPGAALVVPQARATVAHTVPPPRVASQAPISLPMASAVSPEVLKAVPLTKEPKLAVPFVKEPKPAVLFVKEPKPAMGDDGYEERVDQFIDRCIDTTDAMTVEVVEKGQVHFTVETLSNMAMLTMEQLAVNYFGMLPEGEIHVSVSIVDDNGDIAGTRVFPRSAFAQ